MRAFAVFTRTIKSNKFDSTLWVMLCLCAVYTKMYVRAAWPHRLWDKFTINVEIYTEKDIFPIIVYILVYIFLHIETRLICVGAYIIYVIRENRYEFIVTFLLFYPRACGFARRALFPIYFSAWFIVNGLHIETCMLYMRLRMYVCLKLCIFRIYAHRLQFELGVTNVLYL